MYCWRARLLLGTIGLALFMSAATHAAEVALRSIIANPASFNHQSVTLRGTAIRVRETTSRAGNEYTTFKLEDPSGGGAVNVFTWGHPTLKNGDHIRVDGVFETEHHQGRYTFYNEVEAAKVSVLPQ